MEGLKANVNSDGRLKGQTCVPAEDQDTATFRSETIEQFIDPAVSLPIRQSHLNTLINP